MSAHSRPYHFNVPDLSAESVRLCIEKTHDLVLLISTEGCIAGAFQTHVFDANDINFWIGQHLASVVSPDSKVKIPLLFNNDASANDSDAIWRHINLIGRNKNTIPVRALYATLQDPNETIHCLFCRDLRPSQDMHNRFIALQQDLLHENSILQANLRQNMQGSDAQHLTIGSLVKSIKQSSYQQVIFDTVQSLERDCMRALLSEVSGDHNRAATLAGCTLTDWLTKAATLNLMEEQSP